MYKRIPVWLAVSICLLVSAAVMIGTFFFVSYSYGLNQTSNGPSLFSKLQTIGRKVNNEFYREIDQQKLQDAAIEGYIAGLEDKYAAYYSADETKQNNADMQGKNVGIGINYVVEPKTGYIYIERVHSQSPADNAGFLAGDRIIAISDTKITNKNRDTLIEEFANLENRAVKVTVSRADNSEASLEVVPAEYNSQSVWYDMIGATAYVYITEFEDTTPIQLKTAMEAVEGAENVIFDLRSNPGGAVNSVGKCLDYLLPEGDLIVATYKDGSKRVLRKSDNRAALKIPAVVLVDKLTASSGEVFALAMRDIYSADIVGETTFGKGIMQTTYTLEDGSSYKFSTATISSHSGTEYNGVGVVPDITVNMTDEEKISAAMAPITEDEVVKMALELLKSTKE